MKKLSYEEKVKKIIDRGYRYAASVVKQVFNTKYYHVVLLEDLLKNGKWIPARHVMGMPWHGPVGSQSSAIDWRVTYPGSIR